MDAPWKPASSYRLEAVQVKERSLGMHPSIAIGIQSQKIADSRKFSFYQLLAIDFINIPVDFKLVQHTE